MPAKTIVNVPSHSRRYFFYGAEAFALWGFFFYNFILTKKQRKVDVDLPLFFLLVMVKLTLMFFFVAAVARLNAVLLSFNPCKIADW